MFQRGLDVKEILELGEFAPMVKEIRKYFEDRLIHKVYQKLWFDQKPHSSFMSNFTDEIICKNIPDFGGGNVNRFIIWAHRTSNDYKFKDYIKRELYDIKTEFKKFNCSVNAINYYIAEKYKRKYDLPLDKKGLIVEIIYSKKKK